MNLKIGKNIRSFRKQLDITQEQLAEWLGVSYQSVSRWENETTYPDMELLPAIAKIFSISVDKLIGIPEAEKEEKAKETFNELRREVLKKERDIPKIIEIIRDIRRNYLDSESMWMFWNMGNDRCYRHPEILPEVRLTAEAFIENTKQGKRYSAIGVMSKIEDEEHIDDFLAKYATEYDISKNYLLKERYWANQNHDKYEYQRQLHLYLQIGEICNRQNFYELGQKPTIQESMDIVQFQLNMLHSLCQTVPSQDNPVSGNGQVDFLIEERLEIGFRMASYFAEMGEKEKAICILEDCTQMIEKIMSISKPIKLKCSSPWLKNFVWDAEPGWFNKYNNPDGDEEYNVYIHHSGYCYMIYPSTYYHYVTINNQGWEAFDSIRDDERYKKIVERLKKQINVRSKTNKK